MFWYFTQLAFFVFYVTYVLRYNNEFTGPFVSSTKFVYNDVTMKSRPVNTFDYMRRFLYNPYSIQDELWIENTNKLEGWDCPVCLSFWVSLLSCIVIGLLYNVIINPIAIAGMVTVMFILLEKDYGVQLQKQSESGN